MVSENVVYQTYASFDRERHQILVVIKLICRDKRPTRDLWVENHYFAATFLHVPFSFRVIRVTRHKFNFGWISVELGWREIC
jgi:hypothetical protein